MTGIIFKFVLYAEIWNYEIPCMKLAPYLIAFSAVHKSTAKYIHPSI